MFCTHSSKKEKKKGRKRAVRLSLETQWRSSGSLNALGRKSHQGRDRAQSSTAKFGIEDTHPWQFALCPSGLAVRVPPQAPAFPSLFQSKGQNLQRRKFPSWQKNPNQPPHHPEKWEGRSPRGKMALPPSRPWGEAGLRQIQGACEERSCRFTRGLDHQRRHSTEGSGLCVVTGAFAVCSSLSSELPCSVGHRAAATFYFRASVHTPCECPGAAALKHGDNGTCYMCIDHC